MNSRLVKITSMAFMFLMASLPASANMIWPELYITDHTLDLLSSITEYNIESYCLILGGLVLEWPFVQKVTRFSWAKAFIATLVINAASLCIGLVAIPLGGFVFQFILAHVYQGYTFLTGINVGTFNPAGWGFAGFFTITLTAFIEFLALKIIFRKNVQWTWFNFLMIWAANTLSVGIVLIHMLYISMA